MAKIETVISRSIAPP